MHLHSVRHSHQLGNPPSIDDGTQRDVAYLDPLDGDLQSDARLDISHRELGRLLFIAAETGARFQREEADHDPVAWLFSPRALFGGRAAVDACKERLPFVRALILHGLSLGLDAEPAELDELLTDEEDQAPTSLGMASKPSKARARKTVQLSPA